VSPRQSNRERQAEKVRQGRRKARRTTCRRCGRPVWHGLDGDVLAFEVDAETWQATAADEVLAHAAGRWSFTLTGYDVRELTRRDRFHVRASPGKSSRLGGTVHLAHECADGRHQTRDEPRDPTLFDHLDPDAPPPF